MTNNIENKKIIVIIGQDENKKLNFINSFKDYITYINPENNRHPILQKQFVENIIQNANKHNQNILISTNSPYVLTTLNNLVYAGKLKYKISKNDFIEIMGDSNNYIFPQDISAFKIVDEPINIISKEDEIIVEEIDEVTHIITAQYTKLYYEETRCEEL